jgi:hypothetical protein
MVWAQTPNQKVLVGRDGWLVYVDPEAGNIKDYLKIGGRTDAEMAELALDFNEAVRGAKAVGAELLWIIPPNAPTVYPESMPKYLKPAGKKSRLEQISESRAFQTNPHFLNLTDVLIRNKEKSRLYQKTDTHWNDYGAWVGYGEIVRRMAALNPAHARALAPWKISDFKVTHSVAAGGDLARMLGLQQSMTEEVITLVPLKPRQAAVREQREGYLRTTLKDDPTAPRLLMYRDSFTNSLVQYLSEHFSTAIYLNSIDASDALETAKKEKVDYLVIEAVERNQHEAIAMLKQIARASRASAK